MKKIVSILTLGSLLNLSSYADEKIIEIYNNRVPKSVPIELKYSKDVPQILRYVIVKGLNGNLRREATTNSEIVDIYPYGTKLQVLEKKQNRYGHIWYRVKDGTGKKGYISANTVAFREFQFNTMMKKIKELESFIGKEKALSTTHSYRPNPNNQNLKWEKDKYGTPIDQSIVAEYRDEKIFIPDKSVLSIIGEDKENAYVKVASIPEYPLKIKKSYLDKGKKVQEEFKKLIAIDVTNQNFGVFEKMDGQWKLISYVYSKTGMDSQVGFETPKGFFMVPMLRHEMPYRSEDGSSQGYAKFATRFSGGGYIHGTPINYEEEINREFFKGKKEKDMGTFAGTRKCIRTSEGHAKFLFDWVMEGSKKTTDNTQYPKENVMVIAF